MPQSEDQRCGTCRFYTGYVCRRYPPVPVFETYDNVRKGYQDSDVHSRWPTVEEDDWCGEWSEKEDGNG